MFLKISYYFCMIKVKKIAIVLFSILWILVFHYESLRAFYLSPLVGKQLPKIKFLFPPAGWVMFYEIQNYWSTAEVYGMIDEKTAKRIDPHKIFQTRFVGFDNIHRNIMVNVMDKRVAPQFCKFLNRKFPDYKGFVIGLIGYPRLVPEKPQTKVSRLLYQC